MATTLAHTKKHSCVDEKAKITCSCSRTKLDYLHAKRVEWIIDRFCFFCRGVTIGLLFLAREVSDIKADS